MSASDYRNNCLLSLQFTAQTFDPAATRFLDISPNRIHAGYTAGATAPVKLSGQRGASFSGAQYLTGATNGVFNQAEFSASFLFAPTFAHDDGLGHAFLDTSDASRYLVSKAVANTLYVMLGHTNVLAIAAATYGPYWKLNQYNTLTVMGVNGDNQAVLNGVSVGISATAWAAANPANYWICSRFNGADCFAGRMYQVECRPIRMTMLHALDWHINAMKSVNAV